MAPPPLSIHPPLLNSACPWATTAEHLRSLLESPSTGAITVRTSLLAGFDHQPARHRFVFFDPAKAQGSSGTHSLPDDPAVEAAYDEGPSASATLNNLGYSPITLQEYMTTLRSLSAELPHLHHKTVIVSVTGSREQVSKCYEVIAAETDAIAFPLAMEVNLSCPNIPGAPPVAYDADALTTFLTALPTNPVMPVGIKTPPYTHAGQYSALLEALRTSSSGDRLSFVTATNTLGSCLVLASGEDPQPSLPAGGVGGMAGPPLHPLSLGNVSTIRKLLDGEAALRSLSVIGVGGVGDGQTYRNMRAVGAYAVALASALGKHGTGVFSGIESDISSVW